MGDKATEQRARLRKGLEGEYLAMDYFDARQISFFALEQSSHTWSQSLALANCKRPDFIIWNSAKKPRLIDVKNYTVNVKGACLNVEHTEIRSLTLNAQTLCMMPLLAFVLEKRYLFFLKLDDIPAPPNIGQSHSIAVEPGPSRYRDGFRPQWIPSKAIVSWDAQSPGKAFLNEHADPAALFT